MQTISNISKWLIIAFSITCSIVFLLHYEKPIVSDYAAYANLSGEIALGYEKEAMPNDLLDAISILKMAKSIKLGNSIAEQSVKPHQAAPIWVDIADQLKLDHYAQNPRVKAQIHEILNDKESFQAALNRSAPYIYYIYSQTEARHLPAELALIPIIESEYNPYDHNSIGATGLWQLMPGTARGLGVKMRDGYDGRLSVVDSTNAALTFFNDLGTEFHHNWYLALAAYNCGPGCVASAVKQSKSTDYFNLRFPLETKLYVPRLLAVAEIIKHAKEYGIVLPSVTDTPYFKEIKIEKKESLASYANSTDTNVKVLQQLNPEYKPNTLISDTLLVPIDNQTVTIPRT